jgi:hypothetical protein
MRWLLTRIGHTILNIASITIIACIFELFCYSTTKPSLTTAVTSIGYGSH